MFDRRKKSARRDRVRDRRRKMTVERLEERQLLSVTLTQGILDARTGPLTYSEPVYIDSPLTYDGELAIVTFGGVTFTDGAGLTDSNPTTADDVSLSGGVAMSGATLSVAGDLYLSGDTVSLSGATLSVAGDLELEAGKSISISGGSSLVVGDDLKLEAVDISDSVGNYSDYIDGDAMKSVSVSLVGSSLQADTITVRAKAKDLALMDAVRDLFSGGDSTTVGSVTGGSLLP